MKSSDIPEDLKNLSCEEAVLKLLFMVKERQIPELDDDFAQDIDEDVENLAELREKLAN